jgi:hypothetical protein
VSEGLVADLTNLGESENSQSLEFAVSRDGFLQGRDSQFLPYVGFGAADRIVWRTSTRNISSVTRFREYFLSFWPVFGGLCRGNRP